MNVLFVNRTSRNVGSSRIWVHDLSDYLSQAGHRVGVSPELKAGHYDAVILGKGMFSPETARYAKERSGGAAVGWINASVDPSAEMEAVRKRLQDVDFLIAGSIEERDSLLPYKERVFIFPLIERIYSKRKVHVDHEPIVIGYHGNAVHLTELYPHATRAIEILAREVPLRMIAVHGPAPGWEWREGKPDIDVEEVEWDIDTIEDQLLRCDIGIVPGITPITPAERDGALRLLNLRGYRTDYLLRFKNKSNAGRSFVFHQLHIPVVAAFMPSHFHILANPDCGFLAHTTAGWLDGLRTLASSAQARTRIGRAAADEFNRLYDPKQWTERLCRQLSDVAAQARRNSL